VFIKKPRAGFVRFSRNCPVSVLTRVGNKFWFASVCYCCQVEKISISLLLLPASKSVWFWWSLLPFVKRFRSRLNCHPLPFVT
jgi:hypothetical protein